MSTPSTSNRPLLFVTRQPAWERKVKLRQSMRSDVFVSRGGLPQKTGRHSRGVWQISYSAVLSRIDAAARKARAAEEIRSPLVVPFWTEKALTTSAVVADAVSIDRVPDLDWFTAGDYVYLSSGLGAQFREILSVAGSVLTFEADEAGLDYLAGADIWPCRFCIREASGATFETTSEDSVVEPLTYETL